MKSFITLIAFVTSKPSIFFGVFALIWLIFVGLEAIIKALRGT